MLTTVIKSTVSYFDLEGHFKTKRLKSLLFGFTTFLVDCPIHFNLL